MRITLLFLLFAFISISQTITYYVSPTGSDANPGTFTLPFKTLDKAKLTIRTHSNKSNSNFNVFLRGGQFPISSELFFDELDGGNNGYRVVYQNYPGEEPVISGGISYVSGWQSVPGKPYKKLAVNELNFRQLYINGHRKQRAKTKQLAKAFGFINNAQNGILVDTTFFNYFTNVSNVEIHMQIEWQDLYFKIDSLKKGNGPFYRIYANFPTAPGGTFYLENSLDLLDEKGEWFMDNISGNVYYYPEDSVDINTATVTIPVTERLLTIKGSSPNTKVNKLYFKGINFSYAGWQAPNSSGFLCRQGAELFLPVLPNPNFGGIYNWTNKIYSNIYCENADSLVFNSCKFQHLGALALDLRNGIYRSSVSCNYFYDISEGGLSVSDAQHDKIETIGEDSCNYISITNNVFYKTGQDYYSAIALSVFYASKIAIEYNQIMDCPNSGISIGWGWQATPWSSNTCNNNSIKYNNIGNYLKKTNDGGGVYTLGPQPGTTISYNYIHHEGNGFAGLYFDDGSRYITTKNNIFSKTHYWLYLWTGSIQNILLDSCYTDTSLVYNYATNSVFTNTFLVANANWPTNAQLIMFNSGLKYPCLSLNQYLPSDTITGTTSVTIPLNYTISLADNLNLMMNVSDTLNLSGYKDYFWEQLSGPGTVTFTYPKLPNTRAAFSLPGIYTIKCRYDNDYQTTAKTITVTVNNYNLCDNIALNKYAKSLSIGHASPAQLVDGSISTFFETQFFFNYSSLDSASIQLNLGNPQTIKRIEIVDRQDPISHDFGCYGITVYVSNDSTFAIKTFFNAIYVDGPIPKQGTMTFNNTSDTNKYKFIKFVRNSPYGNSIAEIRVYNFPSPKIVSPNVMVCCGESALLTAIGAISYTWSTGSISNSISVSPNSATYYYVSNSNSSGCVNKDSCLVTPFNCANGINEQLKGLDLINIYPNPTNADLTIDVAINTTLSGEIYSLDGKVISDKFKLSAGKNLVTTNGLDAGSYIIRLMNENYSVFKKFIKIGDKL